MGVQKFAQARTPLPIPRPEAQRWGGQELTALLESLSEVAPACPPAPDLRAICATPPPASPSPANQSPSPLDSASRAVSISKLHFYLRRQTFPRFRTGLDFCVTLRCPPAGLEDRGCLCRQKHPREGRTQSPSCLLGSISLQAHVLVG